MARTLEDSGNVGRDDSPTGMWRAHDPSIPTEDLTKAERRARFAHTTGLAAAAAPIAGGVRFVGGAAKSTPGLLARTFPRVFGRGTTAADDVIRTGASRTAGRSATTGARAAGAGTVNAPRAVGDGVNFLGSRVVGPAVTGAVAGQIAEEVFSDDGGGGGGGGPGDGDGTTYVLPEGSSPPGGGAAFLGAIGRGIASNPILTLAAVTVAGAVMRDVVSAAHINRKLSQHQVGRYVGEAGEILMAPGRALSAPVDILKAVANGDAFDRVLDALRR